MYCPGCGKELTEGSLFCRYCGEKVSERAKMPNELDMREADIFAQDATVYQADDFAGGIPVKKDPVLFPEQGTGSFVKPKRKNKRLFIWIAAAIALLAVVAVAVITRPSLPKAKGGNAYAYLADGKYKLITDIKKGESIEIASRKTDDDQSRYWGENLKFSPDGKYIYYFTKIDDQTKTGTLCRAEYAKLKDNSDKNDKYISVIASNVLVYTTYYLDDGRLVYRNEDNTLFYYNGEESERIAKDVLYVRVPEKDQKHLLFATDSYSEGYTLYGVSLKDPGNRIKLASDIRSEFFTGDVNNALYSKKDNDGLYSLYSVGINKEKEKICSDVVDLKVMGDKVFFFIDSGKTVSAYDYVEDSFAEADKNLKEPDERDFYVPSYSYSMISGKDLRESEFHELYTSCTRELYWYGTSGWWNYSMEEAVQMDWGDNTEAVHAATQNFIDRFGALADEDGFIPVTDEVKEALQQIQKTGNTPENNWQWLWLCLDRRQTGTTTDYDAYYAAWEKWDEVSDRVALRETLQDPDNDLPLYSLCCYENGKVKTIAENIFYYDDDYFGYYYDDEHSGTLIYGTTDMLTNRCEIEDAYYDPEDTLIECLSTVNAIRSGSEETVYQLNFSDLKDLFDEADIEEIILMKDEVFIQNDEGTVYKAQSKGGVVGSFRVLSDEAIILGNESGVLYYMSDVYDDSEGITYGDLYVYSDGESKCIAKDITAIWLTVYEDDVLLATTDYRYGRGRELNVIDKKGNATYIADEVTQAVRTDKNMFLYISDGDLYAFNGKDNILIESDVDYFWSLNSEKIRIMN